MQKTFLDIPFHGGITKPVHSLVQIFLFFEFLKTVTSLQCEVCSAVDTNCKGNWMTCQPEQETCVIVLIHNNLVPSVDTKPNGRQCPACFSETGACKEELTNCTGDEFYCFHLFMRSYGEPYGIETPTTQFINHCNRTPAPKHLKIHHKKMSSLRSDNVQGLLQFFFCLALLAKGSCLQCETCESNTTSCAGPMRNCTGKEICIALLTKSSKAGQAPVVNSMKGCGSHSLCDWTDMHFDLGREWMYQVKQQCCQKDCTKIDLELPVLRKDPKVKKCPACDSIGEPCKKETVECTGEDADCFTITVDGTTRGKSTQHTMKGCGSKNVCTVIQHSHRHIFMEGENKNKMKCDFSNSETRILASLLTTFYSLCILKLLV
ncbi:uncharacterized protein [Erythrolamprus reginae]|uniref:uncharacterized protein isoform X2 n=1 Tax=Erythrolamprus reginae TaxID=121349 RepID=UPI00396C40DC